MKTTTIAKINGLTIAKRTIKLFGKTGAVYTLHDAKGEVIGAYETLEAAQAAAQ